MSLNNIFNVHDVISTFVLRRLGMTCRLAMRLLHLTLFG
jgi:hypothetical protein